MRLWPKRDENQFLVVVTIAVGFVILILHLAGELH